MKLLPVRILWRHTVSRSCSRLSNLELSDWELSYVEKKTRHILDHAHLDKPSDEVLRHFFTKPTMNIHPPLSLKTISEVEKRPLSVDISNNDSIDTANFERWREKTLTILHRNNCTDDAKRIQKVTYSPKAKKLNRCQLSEMFFPAWKKKPPHNPVDLARLIVLQKSLHVLPHPQSNSLNSINVLELLVQMSVCDAILGDEGVAIFHTSNIVPLPVKLHFLRYLGLSENLCHEVLKTRLPIWTAKSPTDILEWLKKTFDVPRSHEETVMYLKAPATIDKIPNDVLQGAIEEIHEKYDHLSLSVDTKLELIMYIADKALEFNEDIVLIQENQTKEEIEEDHENDPLFKLMIPAKYFDENRFVSNADNSSKYWNTTQLLQARNLSTFGQSRCFSTSRPRIARRKIRLISFEEPNFTRWAKNHFMTFLLRIGLDYQFDRKEFLRGCELALYTITTCIKEHNYANLKGLFTNAAREKLIQEVELEWSEFEKNNIEITSEDLYWSTIERIDIDEPAAIIKVTFTAVKTNVDPPMLITCGIKFRKDYEEDNGGWIVQGFKLIGLGQVDKSQVWK